MAEEVIILNSGELLSLKKVIAKLLHKQGFEQSRISKILNITQPMVSNYISSESKIPDDISEYTNKIIEKIKNGFTPKFQTIISFVELNGEYICAKENELITDEKQFIVNDLTDAFLMLKGKDIHAIMPQVKMNIATSKKKAKDINDIASFSNGLIIMDNQISSINSIQFGKSQHLASLLLYLKSKNNEINSIMNIKYTRSLKKKGFSYSYLSKEFKLKNDSNYDLLFHEGDFGIEPCCYILGKDAKEVAGKVIRLL